MYFRIWMTFVLFAVAHCGQEQATGEEHRLHAQRLNTAAYTPTDWFNRRQHRTMGRDWCRWQKRNNSLLKTYLSSLHDKQKWANCASFALLKDKKAFGFAPGPRWGICPQTTVIGSRSPWAPTFMTAFTSVLGYNTVWSYMLVTVVYRPKTPDSVAVDMYT